MIGVYVIYNKIEDMCYIGSSIDIGSRLSSHFSELRNNKHYNRKLQDSFNKYGETAFEKAVLEECNEDILREVEQFYIRDWDTFINGYNNTDSCFAGQRMPEQIREKIAGLNHWNIKYSREKLEEAFRLLATTNYTAKVISDITLINVYTIQDIAQGGHAWLHVKYPELMETFNNRIIKKEETGSINNNESILLVMQKLLEYPEASFDTISELTNVSKETISAVSSGRQFKYLILDSALKDRALEYYKIGRSMYKNLHTPMPSEIASKISIAILDVIHTNKWKSRDIISKLTGLTTNISRKLTELDISLLDSYIRVCPDINKPNVINYINVRKNHKRVTQHTLDMLEKYNKDDRQVR